jgi:hypothetical protein
VTQTAPASAWLLPLAEIVTVGLPFCAFKALTGLALVPTAALAGGALVALGAVDLLLNLLNLGSLALRRRRAVAVCVADLLLGRSGRGEARGDLGIAVDVCLSFALVALVIGAGWLARVPPRLLPVWNAAVVLNVLGAGIGRLLSALRHRGA